MNLTNELLYSLLVILFFLLILVLLISVEYVVHNRHAKAMLKEAYDSLNIANNEMTAICEKLGAIRWGLKYEVGGEILEVCVHVIENTPQGQRVTLRKTKDLSDFYAGLDEEERIRVEDAVNKMIKDRTGSVGLDVEYCHKDANHPITWYRALGGSTLSEDGKIGYFYGVFMNIDDRIQRQKLEREAATIDYLTRLYNRNSYEQELFLLSENTHKIEKTYFGVVDLNGLKSVNDNIGHEAGDELIKSAAEILQEVFGDYGKCFRIGGDEFVVIAELEDDLFKQLSERMRALSLLWHGQFADKMSFSCGFVKGSEFPEKTLAELIKEADQRMYADKRAYYETSGIDRRK